MGRVQDEGVGDYAFGGFERSHEGEKTGGGGGVGGIGGCLAGIIAERGVSFSLFFPSYSFVSPSSTSFLRCEKKKRMRDADLAS